MAAETQFKNLYDLRQYFKNETVCREYLERFRWDGNPVCPFCYSDKPYKLGDGKTYKCSNKDCKKKFTATVGTIFENTKIPLSKWFVAMYLITAHKKGISSLQLHRDIGVTQKTAWFINHRIREMLKKNSPNLLSGMVEVDETYIGGKETNKHASKKGQSKGEFGGKTGVIGILERNKELIVEIMYKADAKTLIPTVLRNVEQDATVVTDNWTGYFNLKNFYDHKVVSHSTGVYVVDGIYHTNTLEGFWSLLKRGIIGIYHSVSTKHLGRYLVEFSQRYQTRKINEVDRFNYFLSKCDGRLKYKDLIKD